MSERTIEAPPTWPSTADLLSMPPLRRRIAALEMHAQHLIQIIRAQHETIEHLERRIWTEELFVGRRRRQQKKREKKHGT